MNNDTRAWLQAQLREAFIYNDRVWRHFRETIKRAPEDITGEDVMVEARLRQSREALVESAAVTVFGRPHVTKPARAVIMDVTAGTAHTNIATLAKATGVTRQAVHWALTTGVAAGIRKGDPHILAFAHQTENVWVITYSPEVSLFVPFDVLDRMVGVRSLAEVLHGLGNVALGDWG